MLRPMPLPTERTALLVAASRMPSWRPPRELVRPKRSEPMALPMPGPEAAGHLGERAGSHLASLRRAPQQVRVGYLVRREHFFQPFGIEKFDVVQLRGCARLAAEFAAWGMDREMGKAFAETMLVVRS